MPSVERVTLPQEGVRLAPLTTLGIGGLARWFVRASTVEDVIATHKLCADRGVSLFILGGGSNLVVADEGIDGVVLQVGIPEMQVVAHGDTTRIRAGAGVSWDDVVAAAVSRGLAGLECLSGIPGTVGGTPIQNVGAYGQEVSNAIAEVTAFDRTSREVCALRADDCRFGYRTSRFKREDAERFVICEVVFRLHPGLPTVIYPDIVSYFSGTRSAAPTLEDVRCAVLSIRRRKGMVIDALDPDTRSVGSFFVNPVVRADIHAGLTRASDEPAPGFAMADGQVKIPAAWLIEQSGFSRGYRSGRVGLSSKHPLAIVNRGGATARDVLELAVQIKRQVVDRFGIWLQPEPVLAGFTDEPDIAYLRSTSD